MSNDDHSPDKEYIFPQGIIRGLGLLPGGERKKWPDASATTKSTTPEGVGKEPEGVGANLAPGARHVAEPPPEPPFYPPDPPGSGGGIPTPVGGTCPPGYTFVPSGDLGGGTCVPNGPTASPGGGITSPLPDRSPPVVAGQRTNLQAAGHTVTAPTEHAPKFDPRGFWYTHGAFPSKAPQAGHGIWQQVGQHWVWCPSSVTNLPGGLMAVCQVGMPGGGYAWTQVFNNYWVAPQPRIAVG